MTIEIKRFKLADGREGSYAPIGNGLIKMLFDDGDMVIVKEAAPSPPPAKSSDEVAAAEILDWLRGRESDKMAWKKVASLAKLFGAKRVTTALKQRITTSLLALGVELDPPLAELGPEDRVSFSHINPEHFPLVPVRQVPAVLKALQLGAGAIKFAVFMFVPKGRSEDDYLNLQYSVEKEAIGLDWVLLGAGNIQEQGTVQEFAKRHGHKMAKCVLDEVEYLRVEGAGLAELGMQIMSELYQFGLDDKVKLYVEGCEWPNN